MLHCCATSAKEMTQNSTLEVEKHQNWTLTQCFFFCGSLCLQKKMLVSLLKFGSRAEIFCITICSGRFITSSAIDLIQSSLSVRRIKPVFSVPSRPCTESNRPTVLFYECEEKKKKKYPPWGLWQSVRLERNTPGCKHYTTEWDWVMAPGFNTRSNPQLLPGAIIRPAKQLREISTGHIPQGQKVKETLFGSFGGYMSCKDSNSGVR